MTDRCVKKLNVRSHPNQFQCPVEVEGDHKKCIFHRPIEEKDTYKALEAISARLAGTEYPEFAQYPFERTYFDGVNLKLLDVYYHNNVIEEQYLEFTNSKIESVDFNGATNSRLSEGQKLEAGLSFDDCEIREILFRNHPVFDGEVSLEDCDVGTINGEDFKVGKLKLSLCEVEEHVILPEMKADVFQFNSSYGKSYMNLEKSEFDHFSIYIAPDAFRFDVPGRILIGLRETRIETGHISLDSLLYADLTRSKLQNVKLGVDDSWMARSRLIGAELGIQTLRALEDGFLRTRDPLGSYAGPKSAVIDLPERSFNETAQYQVDKIESLEDYLAVVSTYANLRRTAEEDGRSTLASTLFYWEKDWLRQYRYLDLRSTLTEPITRDGMRLRLGDKSPFSLLLLGLKPISYSLFKWVSGYNEKPLRVFISSVATVSIFSLLYLGAYQQVGAEPPYGSSAGYFLLSIESFTTLVLNTNYSVNNICLRLIASVEGFVGAFMIALFVVASTRAFNR